MAVVPPSALAAVVFWGASFVAVKIALESFTPYGLTCARLGLGALGLALWMRVSGERLAFGLRDGLVVIGLGVVLGGHLAIQAFGLTYTSAIHTSWIIGFSPVVIAIGAQLFGGSRLNGTGWIGVTLGALGVFLVTMEELPDLRSARFGDVLQLLSCFTWAFYTLCGAGVVRRHGALAVTTLAMASAALTLVGPALSSGWTVVSPGARELSAFFFLGLVCSALALVLWYHAQATHGSQRTGATLYFEPFATLLIAVPLAGETVGWRAVLGGSIVLAGVLFVARGRKA